MQFVKEITPEEKADIDRKLAIISMTYGSSLPEYIARFPEDERQIIVNAIQNLGFFATSENFEAVLSLLVNAPMLVAALVMSNRKARDLLDTMGMFARQEASTYDMKQVQKDIERYHYQINPGRNAQHN